MKMTMKHCASLLVLAIAATATLASCSSEEMTDNPVETLPEGMYPLTFTATQGEVVASPQTRVSDYDDAGTHKSKWNTGDQITVKVKENSTETVSTTTCTFNENGNITYNPQLYWQTTGNHTINAWYSNITGQNTTSTTVSLADQNTSSGLAYVMKADELIDKNYQSGNLSLNFRHQLAKVRVKLAKGTTTADLTNATVKIKNQYTSCSISNGAVTATGTSNGTITMHTPTTTDGYYEANIVPGTTLSADCFEITAGGKTASATTTAITTTAAATMYTFTITVDKPGPQPITPVDDTFTIKESDDVLIKDYNGSAPIVVNGSAELTLENVQITLGQSKTAVITVGKDARLKLNVTGQDNKLTSNDWGGILLNDNASIEIVGAGIDASYLEVAAGNNNDTGASVAGIGSASNVTSGDITIEKVKIKVSGGNSWAGGEEGGAAIGTSPRNSTCGNISITSSYIEATGGPGAAAIGLGFTYSAGKSLAVGSILIDNSTIDATIKPFRKTFGACIGLCCFSSHAVPSVIFNCGTIIIKNAGEDFLDKLTYEGNGDKVWKIGKGYGSGATINFKGGMFNGTSFTDGYGSW